MCVGPDPNGTEKWLLSSRQRDNTGEHGLGVVFSTSSPKPLAAVERV